MYTGSFKLNTKYNLTLLILQKRVARIISGVYLRSLSEPLFTTLKFLNCENIFKYLTNRLMCRIYYGELCVLHNLFTKNSDIYVHNTRRHKCHYHMPSCNTNLRKCGLRYVGVSDWKSIPNVSEFIFSSITICETDKEPVNPTGSPAPFAPIIM